MLFPIKNNFRFKPPDFSLEKNANDESQAQEVQRDLVVKFAQHGSRNDKNKDLKSKESSEIRNGETNNNALLDNDNSSVTTIDSGNVLYDDVEGSSDDEDNVISLRKGEHTVTVHTDSQAVLNILEDEDAKYAACNDSFSIVDENNLSLAVGGGDIWGPIESLSGTTLNDNVH